MKLKKYQVDRYKRCQGACQICYNDGDCNIQMLIKIYGKEAVIEAIDDYGVNK